MLDLMKLDATRVKASVELDALIAEKWIGAKWLRFHDANYVGPDSIDGRTHAFLVLPEDLDFFLADGKYVKDTGECPRDGLSWLKGWSPSTHPAHAGEARRVKKYVATLVSDGVGWRFSFYTEYGFFAGGCRISETNGDKGAAEALAICRAILAAMQAAEKRKRGE